MKISIAILAALFLIIGFKAMGQDVIIKNDQTEINSVVIELTDDVIKYRKFDLFYDPICSINKSEVFMIIYKNGKKEYIKTKPKVVTSDTTVVGTNSTTTNTHSVAKQAKKRNVGAFMVGSNYKFNEIEISWMHPIIKNIYWGGSLIYSFSTTGTGLYPYLAYKQPLGSSFNVWAKTGFTYTDFPTSDTAYFLSGYYTTTGYTGSLGFLGEIGADYMFTHHSGITVYTSNLSSLFFGIVYRP
jgi:hypothetical protein